jgi:signal peptidase I
MARLGPWLRERAPGLHKFLTRRDRPWPLVREVLIGIAVIVVLLGGLYGFTGQPLSGGYPVVVVTSGSMMHCTNYPTADSQLGKTCDDASFGRLGTIDPGDLVFVRHISSQSDVVTKAQGWEFHYGEPGDVIVYKPHRDNVDVGGPPVIHRALFWLQVNGDGTYTVPDIQSGPIALDDARVVALAGCTLDAHFYPHGTTPWTPSESGFITRGDNNLEADQCRSNSFWYEPARVDITLGKAAGEVPWIGLINLWWGDVTHHSQDFDNAAGDCKLMLGVVAVLLIATPWVVEFGLRRGRRRRQRQEDAEQEPEAPRQPPK